MNRINLKLKGLTLNTKANPFSFLIYGTEFKNMSLVS